MNGVLALALALAAPATPTQTPGVLGTWKVSYVAGAHHEGGRVSLITATGTLKITQRGDSLSAELAPDPVPNAPASPASTLTGVLRDGTAVLVTTSFGVVVVNGEERSITVIQTWTLRADGDSLTGSVDRRIEEMPAVSTGAPTQVTGRRSGPA